jgi:LacI family transcriptional regulator
MSTEDVKVTLEMVAEHAGVSPSTVSRILNGTAIVSDEKRDAVDRTIAEPRFVPDVAWALRFDAQGRRIP